MKDERLRTLMKRVVPFTRLFLLAMMFSGMFAIAQGQAVLAAKPSGPDHNVVEMSNGYPSGPHFNLNIHGKKYGFNCPEPDPLTGYGSSLFIPEYQSDYPSPPNPPTVIEYIASKKHDVDKLTVLDACSAQFDNLDDNNARVQIPKTGIYSDGFWVFARVRAKPNNSEDDGEPSNIILTPNPNIKVCNDGEADLDGDGVVDDCPTPDSDLLALGLITSDGAYKPNSDGKLERFDPDSGHKGKGKAKATDMTGLFTWTGYVCPADLDTDGDGDIDEDDVAADLDGDGTVGDADDLDIYLATFCEFHNSEWVFNVANLVLQEQEVENDGVKLLKLRFYPVATTEFTPTTPDVVSTIHDAADDSEVTGGTAPVGTSIYASAMLTAGTGPTPEGTVDFHFYGNGSCDGAGVIEAGVSLSSGVAESSTQGPLMAGIYSYQTHYNGDDPNDFYNESDSTCVSVAVGEIPMVTLEIHDSGEIPVTMVPDGATVHPQATVSGSGVTPTGSVTFMWFNNGSCTPLAADTSLPEVLDGLGVAHALGFTQTPMLADPTVAVVYSFRGIYSGDSNYLPAFSNCETLTVEPIP